jgi:hypothetical protein
MRTRNKIHRKTRRNKKNSKKYKGGMFGPSAGASSSSSAGAAADVQVANPIKIFKSGPAGLVPLHVLRGYYPTLQSRVDALEPYLQNDYQLGGTRRAVLDDMVCICNQIQIMEHFFLINNNPGQTGGIQSGKREVHQTQNTDTLGRLVGTSEGYIEAMRILGCTDNREIDVRTKHPIGYIATVDDTEIQIPSETKTYKPIIWRQYNKSRLTPVGSAITQGDITICHSIPLKASAFFIIITKFLCPNLISCLSTFNLLCTTVPGSKQSNDDDCFFGLKYNLSGLIVMLCQLGQLGVNCLRELCECITRSNHHSTIPEMTYLLDGLLRISDIDIGILSSDTSTPLAVETFENFLTVVNQAEFEKSLARYRGAQPLPPSTATVDFVRLCGVKDATLLNVVKNIREQIISSTEPHVKSAYKELQKKLHSISHLHPRSKLPDHGGKEFGKRESYVRDSIRSLLKAVAHSTKFVDNMQSLEDAKTKLLDLESRITFVLDAPPTAENSRSGHTRLYRDTREALALPGIEFVSNTRGMAAEQSAALYAAASNMAKQSHRRTQAGYSSNGNENASEQSGRREAVKNSQRVELFTEQFGRLVNAHTDMLVKKKILPADHTVNNSLSLIERQATVQSLITESRISSDEGEISVDSISNSVNKVTFPFLGVEYVFVDIPTFFGRTIPTESFHLPLIMYSLLTIIQHLELGITQSGGDRSLMFNDVWHAHYVKILHGSLNSQIDLTLLDKLVLFELLKDHQIYVALLTSYYSV